MKDRRLAPQEKKALSLERDRRNVYGQNAKASRKAIPRRKAHVRRSYRHAVRQELREALGEAGPAGLEEVDSRVAAVRRGRWRKVPDAPLGAVLSTRLTRWRVQAPDPESEALVARLERRWLSEAAAIGTPQKEGPAPRSKRWRLDPDEVWCSTSGSDHADGPRVLRSGTVTLRHPATGMEAGGGYPEGVYTSGQVRRLQRALQARLFAELQQKVAACLRLPGRTS
jgi:hypothetical protein